MLLILFIVLVILAIVTAARLMKVFEWTAVIRGKKPYEISENENNINALLVLLSAVGMFGMFFYLTNKYYNGDYMLPESASEHGRKVDSLLELNFMVIVLVFFLTQTLLMYFAYRYRYNKKRKALHYAHNNRLELIWTVIPAIVLAVLILKGLMVWNESTRVGTDPNGITIELYAKQFEWAARYAGDDKELGQANYCLISSANPLGVVSGETIDSSMAEIQKRIQEVEWEMANKFPNEDKLADLRKELRRRKHQLRVIADFKVKQSNQAFVTGYDDVILLYSPDQEIHIPLGREIRLKMRSQDVIHSAYLPHFRVHMYCVPGYETQFTFKPIITTQEMRDKLGNQDFNYLLYCNNICGSSHFAMQMKIVVDTEEEYAKWWKEQQTFRQTVLGDTTATNQTADLIK